MNLSLEWWNPNTVCWPEEITRDRVWIRILGLPLCLWSQNTFEQIGEQCSGYIETEETSLKHHLHWARIKVKGDGKSIPPEIEVVGGGMVFIISIWVEAPVTFRVEKEKTEVRAFEPVGN